MHSSCCLSTAERRPGWEDRLAAVIEAARSAPYELGRHDCFRLACSVIDALTGIDLWAPFAGSYASRREALRRIAEFEAAGFTAAASKLFGSTPMPMPFARRGDVCEFRDEDGEQHLGIVLGVKVALLGPEGLAFAGRDECRHCWRIG